SSMLRSPGRSCTNSIPLASMWSMRVNSRGAATHRSHGRKGLLLKWWSGEFSPPLRGGVAARSRKSRGASLARADGVVFNLNKILRNLITTPSAPQRRLRDILLMSRPPLLEEEGKIAHSACGQQTGKPVGECRLEPCGGGTKDSQEICRPSGA